MGRSLPEAGGRDPISSSGTIQAVLGSGESSEANLWWLAVVGSLPEFEVLHIDHQREAHLHLRWNCILRAMTMKL